jgi:hypothetical protein
MCTTVLFSNQLAQPVLTAANGDGGVQLEYYLSPLSQM